MSKELMMDSERAFDSKKNSDGKKVSYNSKELFCGTNEIEIHHEKESYRLILTKAGKLVLNK